jgi:hypothetical protein
MILALSISIAASMSPGGCQDPEPREGPTLELRLREWYARTEGTIEADAAGPGSKISLAADLDLGHRDVISEPEVVFHLSGSSRLYASWWRDSPSRDQTLTRTITFRGRSFASGIPIHSSVVFDVAALSFEYTFAKLPLGDLGVLEFSGQAGFRGFWAEGSIRTTGEEASARGFAVTPVLGGHVAYLIRPWLRADADASGMKISLSSESFSYLETKAEIVAKPLEWLVAGIGYKYVTFHDRYSGSATSIFDADLSGGYLMVGVRF